MNAIVTSRHHRQASSDAARLPVSATDDIAASGVDLDQFIALTKQEYLFGGDGATDERANGNGRLRSLLARRAGRPSTALPASAGAPVHRGRNGEAPKRRGKAAVRPEDDAGGAGCPSRFGRIVTGLGVSAAGLTLLAAVGVLATKYMVVLFG